MIVIIAVAVAVAVAVAIVVGRAGFDADKDCCTVIISCLRYVVINATARGITSLTTTASSIASHGLEKLEITVPLVVAFGSSS